MSGDHSKVIQYRLARAWETLEDARILAHSKRWHACVNRMYYACFYMITGLLLTQGVSSSKHTGIRGLFNLHFVKPGTIDKDIAKIYNDLFERRQESDYIDFIQYEESQMLEWLSQTEKFLQTIAKEISQPDW